MTLQPLTHVVIKANQVLAVVARTLRSVGPHNSGEESTMKTRTRLAVLLSTLVIATAASATPVTYTFTVDLTRASYHAKGEALQAQSGGTLSGQITYDLALISNINSSASNAIAIAELGCVSLLDGVCRGPSSSQGTPFILSYSLQFKDVTLSTFSGNYQRNLVQHSTSLTQMNLTTIGDVSTTGPGGQLTEDIDTAELSFLKEQYRVGDPAMLATTFPFEWLDGGQFFATFNEVDCVNTVCSSAYYQFGGVLTDIRQLAADPLAVPEPGTLALAGLALAAVGAGTSRARRSGLMKR